MSAVRPGASTDPAWPADAVEVGRIMDPWGVKGWFKVQPFTANPQALFASRHWHLLPPDAAPHQRHGAGGRTYPTLLKITSAKEHGGGVVAQAQDVLDRSAALALRGARVFIGRASFPTPGPGEFYWVDLVGLRVVNRQGQVLGTVVGLIDAAAHSVLRVAPDAAPAQELAPESERLIPFVSAYVDDVSLERHCITVDWGLDY